MPTDPKGGAEPTFCSAVHTTGSLCGLMAGHECDHITVSETGVHRWNASVPPVEAGTPTEPHLRCDHCGRTKSLDSHGAMLGELCHHCARGDFRLVHPATPAASPAALMPHDWFTPEGIGYECCRKCGRVRRRDGVEKPCPGPVGMRVSASPAAPTPDDACPECPPGRCGHTFPVAPAAPDGEGPTLFAELTRAVTLEALRARLTELERERDAAVQDAESMTRDRDAYRESAARMEAHLRQSAENRDVLEAKVHRAESALASREAELARLRRQVELSAVRFDLLAGRFRGCEAHERNDAHELSIEEAEAFAAEARTSLASRAVPEPGNG